MKDVLTSSYTPKAQSLHPRMAYVADKMIVALDVATEKEALRLVETLRQHISRFKVGLQLYTSAGPQIVGNIVRTGAKVFLDLKLHDIPHTVEGAVASALNLGVEMLTIHLGGGEAMIEAAVKTAGQQAMILGVTVLTSQSQETLSSIGIDEDLEQHVLRLARLGVQCGVPGLVASAREAAVLRKELGPQIKIVTPGIRPSWAATGDQHRISSPRVAIDAGADYLVIGRPIIADPDPAAAVQRVIAELQPASS